MVCSGVPLQTKIVLGRHETVAHMGELLLAVRILARGRRGALGVAALVAELPIVVVARPQAVVGRDFPFLVELLLLVKLPLVVPASAGRSGRPRRRGSCRRGLDRAVVGHFQGGVEERHLVLEAVSRQDPLENCFLLFEFERRFPVHRPLAVLLHDRLKEGLHHGHPLPFVTGYGDPAVLVQQPTTNLFNHLRCKVCFSSKETPNKCILTDRNHESMYNKEQNM